MVKAKEALSASNLDVEAALDWLQKDLAAGGAAKQAKLAGRTTKEGLIAVGVIGEGWGRRGGILEVRRSLRG
jgi:elongation factor Ts